MTCGPFLSLSPDDFSYPKRCFMFAVFAFKIKVSLIFRMIQWTYQWARNYTTIQQVSLSRNRPQASPLSAFFFKFVRISARLVQLFFKKIRTDGVKGKRKFAALFRNGRMEEMTDNQLFQILSAHFCFLFPTPRSGPYFQLHVLKKKKRKERKKRKLKNSPGICFFYCTRHNNIWLADRSQVSQFCQLAIIQQYPWVSFGIFWITLSSQLYKTTKNRSPS